MCDERERLIGFLYDEVDHAERRRVAAHLDECPECRAEIAGLQATRQDLLAWDVPAHDPIWRPVAPVSVPPPVWKQIPAWAMAAAATAVLASGVMGGLAVHWFSGTPQPTLDTAAPVHQAPVAVPTSVSTTAIEEAVEPRVLDRIRAEVRRDIAAVAAREVSTPAATMPVSMRDATLAALTRRVNELESWRTDQDDWRDRQIRLNASFNDDISGVRSQARMLDNQLMRVSLSSNPGFAR